MHPITKGLSKQLIPIYDRRMFDYPISVLMLAGIKGILIISTPGDISGYRRLLGDGSLFGLEFTHEYQAPPEDLAQAFIIGEAFIGDSNIALVLSDSIFYGQNFLQNLKNAVIKMTGATIFR